jgi:hypothetical protein
LWDGLAIAFFGAGQVRRQTLHFVHAHFAASMANGLFNFIV